jgi:dolichyl-diphosphooligosaccharide---protein glycosyltransferase
LLQLVAFTELVRSHVSSNQFRLLLRTSLVVFGLGGFGAIVGLTMKGWIAPWTGRFYSLFDTAYAAKHIPIIASVSEHQPTAWPAFFMDLNFLIFLFPAGVFLCFKELREEHVFVIIYAVINSYFAGVMVRLMLTLTPVVCVSAAVAVSTLLDTYLDPGSPSDPNASAKEVASAIDDDGPVSSDNEDHPVEHLAPTNGNGNGVTATAAGKKSKKAAPTPIVTTTNKLAAPINPPPSKPKRSASGKTSGVYGIDTRIAVVAHTLFMLLVFVMHCTWVTSSAYSSPSVVLASKAQDGSQHIIDDFREAYYWLRQNTPENAVVMSWWDYGYQIAGFADRPTLVDNNTWNNSTYLSFTRLIVI